MIPSIFNARAIRVAEEFGSTVSVARIRGQRETAAVVGLTSAVGALGGFLIPRGIATSLRHTGSIASALYMLLAFYALVLIVTWRNYLHRH